MIKHWWKALGVVILLYVFLAGLLIPLKTGVETVSPLVGAAGESMTLTVNGYNAHYAEAAQNRAWLKLDSTHLLLAKNIVPVSNNVLTATFDIPTYLPSRAAAPSLTLILDNEIDGYSILPAAVQIKQDSISILLGESLWNNSPLSNIHQPDHTTFPYQNILYETIRNTYFHVPMWFGMIILFYAAFIFGLRYLYKPTTQYRYWFLGLFVALVVLGYTPLSPFKAFLPLAENDTLRIIYHSIMGVSVTLALTGFFATISKVTSPETEDARALSLTKVGVLFGVLGLVTGAVWANYTWGSPWSFDVKQNTSAIAMLMYLAYLVLRGSFDDEDTKARLSAVYSIFAFSMLIVLLFIIPRMYDSLHPGNGGNPGLGAADLDNTMRMIFYPAIIGWTLLGLWAAQLSFRLHQISMKVQENWTD